MQPLLKILELLVLAALGFQLDRRMLDVEALFQSILDAVQNLMEVAAVLYHRMSAQRVDIRGHRPDMQVVNFAHAVHRFDGLAHFIEADALWAPTA